MAKEVNKRVNIWLNQQGIDNNLKSIRAAINKTANELNKLPIGSEEWLRKSEKLSKLKSIYSEIKKEIGATSQELGALNRHTRDQMITLGALSSAAQTASAAFRRFVSATQEYVDAYATLDDAMSAVQKTTGMTREEVEALHKSLKDIDTRTSTEELLKIAEIGGRMGLAKEQIHDFTEAVNKANVALGDSFQGGAEEISSILGKIALAYKETRYQNIGESLTQIGSALNEVGASANATESNIAAFVQRVGSMPEVFRPTVQQAVALGAAFEESSIEAEVASRAFGIVMTKASTNVEGFAAAMHKPVKEIENLINTNPAQFFVEFAESLNGLKGTEVGKVLKDLKLNADGVNKIIGAMSTNTERFTEILNTSNTAFSEAISLDSEYAVVNENSAAQLEKAKKKMEDARQEMGNQLIPILTKLYETIGSVSQETSRLIRWLKEHNAILQALTTTVAVFISTVAAAKLIERGVAATKTVIALNTELKALGITMRTLGKGGIIGAVAVAIWEGAKGLQKWSDNAQKAIMHTDALARAYQEAVNKIEAAQAEETRNLEELIFKINESNTPYQTKLELIEQLNNILPGYYDLLKQEGDIYIDTAQALKDLAEMQDLKFNRDALTQTLESITKEYDDFLEKNGKKVRDFRNEMLKASDKAVNAKNPIVRYFYSLKSAMHTSNETFKNAAAREAQNFTNIIASLETQIKDYDLQINNLETRMKGRGNKQENNQQITNNNNGGNGTGADSDNRLKEIKAFQSELKSLREQSQTDLLTGWDKTKAELENKWDDIIEKARKIYGKNSKMVNDLEDEKLASIADAGQKYIQTQAKTLDDFSRKIQDWAKEVLPKGDNEVLDAMLGTEQKWAKRFTDANTQLEEFRDLRKKFVKGNVDTTALDKLIEKLETEMSQMADLEVQDIQKTLQKYQKDIDTFITNEQKDVSNATISETERQKQAIKEKYELEIQMIEKLKVARKAQNGEDADVSDLEAKIEELKRLLNQQLSNVDTNAGKSANKTIWQQLAEFDWSKMSENWQRGLDLMTQGLQEFANTAFDIYNSIAQVQDNLMQAELQRAQESYDAQSAALQKQLNSGVISQKNYEAKMAKLQEEKEKKEKKLKHEQFEREKTASIIQATINGALAIANVWSTNAGMPILAAVLTAVTAAVTAAQIAAIATQPNPYAKGGYIRGKQYAIMGEQGDEWVASNRLLRDKESSAIIAALDEYQRGNRYALHEITIPAPDAKLLSQAVSPARRTFATPNQTTNNYYQSSDNSELLKEIRQMNKYLKDPRNRQAVINRNILLEYERMEDELKSMARL